MILSDELRYDEVRYEVILSGGDVLRERVLTLLEPQSRFGDKTLKFQVVCPQNGTAVPKWLTINALLQRTAVTDVTI